MSDKASSSNTPADSPETAEDIFARIQQRRGIPLAEAGQASTPALAEGQTERLVVEEADPAVKPADAPVAQRRLDEEHQAYDDFAARRVSARTANCCPCCADCRWTIRSNLAFPAARHSASCFAIQESCCLPACRLPTSPCAPGRCGGRLSSWASSRSSNKPGNRCVASPTPGDPC